MNELEKVTTGSPALGVHESLIPKEGTSTSSFYVLLATVVVGALFTAAFTFIVKKGYLTQGQVDTFREQLIEIIADALPAVYLTISGIVARAYIKVRGEVSVAKAHALGQIITARESNTESKGV